MSPKHVRFRWLTQKAAVLYALCCAFLGPSSALVHFAPNCCLSHGPWYLLGTVTSPAFASKGVAMSFEWHCKNEHIPAALLRAAKGVGEQKSCDHGEGNAQCFGLWHHVLLLQCSGWCLLSVYYLRATLFAIAIYALDAEDMQMDVDFEEVSEHWFLLDQNTGIGRETGVALPSPDAFSATACTGFSTCLPPLPRPAPASLQAISATAFSSSFA
eukprot:scaffold53025_cov14-Tisochrysis_lutea.AAC.1